MITRETIDGRGATVAYLTRDFEPTDQDSASLLKVRFDDGEVTFLVPKDKGDGTPT